MALINLFGLISVTFTRLSNGLPFNDASGADAINQSCQSVWSDSWWIPSTPPFLIELNILILSISAAIKSWIFVADAAAAAAKQTQLEYSLGDFSTTENIQTNASIYLCKINDKYASEWNGSNKFSGSVEKKMRQSRLNISRLNNSQYRFVFCCIGPGPFNRTIISVCSSEDVISCKRFVNAFSVTTAIILINTDNKQCGVLAKHTKNETIFVADCDLKRATPLDTNAKMSYSIERSNRNGWTFRAEWTKIAFSQFWTTNNHVRKFTLFILVPMLIVPNGLLLLADKTSTHTICNSNKRDFCSFLPFLFAMLIIWFHIRNLFCFFFFSELKIERERGRELNGVHEKHNDTNDRHSVCERSLTHVQSQWQWRLRKWTWCRLRVQIEFVLLKFRNLLWLTQN